MKLLLQVVLRRLINGSVKIESDYTSQPENSLLTNIKNGRNSQVLIKTEKDYFRRIGNNNLITLFKI